MSAQEYAITAKKTRKPILKEHYMDYLDKISDLGTIGNVNFETTRGLHTHFILRTPDKLDYKKLYPTKYGWNVKAVPIYNRKGWKKYIRKDNIENVSLNLDVHEKYGTDTEIDSPQIPILKRSIFKKYNA